MLRLLTSCLVSTLFFTAAFPQPAEWNDSARYHLDKGQYQNAEMWINASLNFSRKSGIEMAKTYCLAGELKDEQGFALQSMTHYKKCRLMAIRHKTFKEEAAADIGIANELIALGNHDSVLFYIGQSRRRDSTVRNLAITDIVAGRYWLEENRLDKAFSNFRLGYEMASNAADKKLMALAVTGMGSVFFRQEPDMKSALEYFRKAIALCDSSKHFNIIARNYIRIANAYLVLGNDKEAAQYMARAKTIVDLSGNLSLRSYCLSSMAILNGGEGDTKDAIKLVGESIRIKYSLGDYRQVQNDLLNLAEWLMSLKNNQIAEEKVKEGISNSKRLKDVVYLHYFYEQLAHLDSLAGRYRDAYAHLRQSAIYKDSVLSLQRIRAVAEVKEKYETEQKEKAIVEKEVIIEQQKYRQAIIVGASLAALLIMSVIVIVIRNNQNSRIQSEKQRQNHIRLQAIVQTQEEVQQSIARDLHDGLIQILGAAKMSLESATAESDNGSNLDRIRKASTILDEACSETRNISQQLLPYSLIRDGLIPALRELVHTSFITYKFHEAASLTRVSSDIEMSVYRIAQELVNNTVKHANASSVMISLEITAAQLTFLFQDDGQGFDPAQSRQGAGLTNMQTRAELMGGRLSITSKPGEGTSVELLVPLL